MLGFYNKMNYGGPFGMNGAEFGFMSGVFGVFFGLFMMLLVVWTLYWKFHALWYAAKHDHKWWFIAMLIINTMGILEIAYLYYFSKQMDVSKHDEKSVPMVPPTQ